MVMLPLVEAGHTIPPWGIATEVGGGCLAKDRTAVLNRLRRIEGQVRGITQMVDEDRYCIDILHQMQAVKAALARAESEILREHAACCVAEAIASGDAGEQRAKFGELIDLFDKVKR